MELPILKFHRSAKCNNFQFLNYHGACSLSIKKAPNQPKDLIKMVSVTLEGLWMVSDRIADFQFYVKFHRSAKCNNFQFLNYHGSCLVIHQKSS